LEIVRILLYMYTKTANGLLVDESSTPAGQKRPTLWQDQTTLFPLSLYIFGQDNIITERACSIE
jgi:hypothetical protein